MASSSSSSAPTTAAIASNKRDGADNHDPPLAGVGPPPPPPPVGHAIYLHHLYLDADPRQRDLPFLWSPIIWGIFAFVAVSSFIMLVWLIFHPIFPRLHVASATMSAIAVTSTAATAECNISLIFTNPNRHLSTIYDSIEIALFYPSQQVFLSKHYLPPFVQAKKSRIAIETNLSFTGVDLGSEVIEAMKHDIYRRSLGLGIKIVAIVRYRNGKWITKSQNIRAYCGGVSFGFTSSYKLGIFLNLYRECEGGFSVLSALRLQVR